MDDEKPLELRDRIALELLNGLISNGNSNNDTLSELQHYICHEDKGVRKTTEKKFEHWIRSCYKVADIMRKVRLSTFE